MFIGEFMCCLPIVWSYIASRRESSSGFFTRETGYGAVAQDDVDESGLRVGGEDHLTGWRVCWMWFPALFDSLSSSRIH